mgnify:CR=1 FL=1
MHIAWGGGGLERANQEILGSTHPPPNRWVGHGTTATICRGFRQVRGMGRDVALSTLPLIKIGIHACIDLP